ncbi:Lhr family ATP-dependent helicase [Microbacterium sp. YY-01]|uniref:Lhr family ATP-dependent helicase n=1 Tax=Microbacterium sp. YY-01 TaxID=3421634 RepID=UPI003D186408
MVDVLQRFTSATQEWFRGAFAAPTDAQVGAWQTISGGEHALVVAPTGSGKTLSAFLWALDTVFRERAEVPDAPQRTRILYISPLKALGVDVERNLRSPLIGIGQAAQRHGQQVPDVTVGVRSGDTPPSERRRLVAQPPDILITTPESLYLMLTSKARETLSGVHTVIVDEVHAVAATKRGAHLALSLERLDQLLTEQNSRPDADSRPPHAGRTRAQRIGLSATVRPLDEVARFLGGVQPVRVVAPRATKAFDVHVVVPLPDLTSPPPVVVDAAASSPNAAHDPDAGDPGATHGPEATQPAGVWPHVEEAIVDRVLQHRSTIVFANSRRLAEKLTARLNEIAASRDDQHPVLAKAHHGSVSKEQRAIVEEELKSGVLRCVVATSSLELGIDMGAVDLVIQVAAPPSAASGLQRIGRAGHQVGEVSRAAIFPPHRADVLHSAVVTERMLAGSIESIRVPQNPLDILAQQTVAACALESIDVEEWFDTVRRSAPFASLPRSAFEATLDLVAGRFPSDEFAELRPRIVWDRDAGTLTGRPGAQRIAVTSGGTIPDRGLFGVFVAGEKVGARVGELDEEMVYESRVGDVFTLGTTSWRIAEITHDRVLVTPAFGQPARVPFWHGDSLGRPWELGKALGQFTREIAAASPDSARERLRESGLDDNAQNNLLTYLEQQKQATGTLPTDRALTVERGHDEVGDWRIILHSPYGMTVHAPWALAVGARIREQWGVEASAVASDDGIIVRLPDAEAEPPGAELFVFDADDIDHVVTHEVGGSALFASRFRECAARALLMPRHNPGKRTPLWQQRQRSAQLLEVARRHPTFPIILETLREVLQDVYDLPALRRLMDDITARRIRLIDTSPAQPSPYARDLLFGYVGAFMYEGDSPLAERRAAALSVDPALLGELLGTVEMRELLDPAVIAQYEREVQKLDPARRAYGAEGVADLLRMIGPLTVDEIAARLASDPAQPSQSASECVEQLVHQRRIIEVTIAGEHRYAAIEDAGRLRDALGTALPVGIPVAFLEPVADPLADIIGRYARTHGPFTSEALAARYGLGAAVVQHMLVRLEQQGRVVSGYFLAARDDKTPEGTAPEGTAAEAEQREWCDSEGLRRLRMRSLAAIRGSVEPAPQTAFARFLPDWQHVSRPLEGVDGVLAAIEQLAGVPIPASAWETLVLPSRVHDYQPSMLDELTASGEVVWAGHGALGSDDGWVSLHPADLASFTLATPGDTPDAGSLGEQIVSSLQHGGASFAAQLRTVTDATNEQQVREALWQLVWAGLVTNDTFAPLRALLSGGSQAHRSVRKPPRTRSFRGVSMGRTAARAGAENPSSRMSGGRWALLPDREQAPERIATVQAGLLLDRYGVVTRGSVQAEGLSGGFAQVYRMLAGFEQAGHCRRGYVIEKLGAAQFAASTTVDRLREFVRDDTDAPGTTASLHAVTLAATDPANPFGAALPWPEVDDRKHRPARKAGALVVIVDGHLALYIERGGRTMLTFSDSDEVVHAALSHLAETARHRRLETMTVQKINGQPVYNGDEGFRMRLALADVGFTATPRGFALRKVL